MTDKEKRDIISAYKKTFRKREELDDRILTVKQEYTTARLHREAARTDTGKKYYARQVCTAEKRLDELSEKRKGYNRLRGKIMALIRTVEKQEPRDLLVDRYINCMLIKEISRKYGYAESTITSRITKAIGMIKFDE